MAKPEWMPQRLYQWTKPRSLMLHFLFVVIAAGCLIAMWWQVHRAMQGNALSYFYSVEWPAIAVVVGIGWWQLVHDTPEDIARRSEYHRRMRAASAQVLARTPPRSVRALTVDSEEVGGRVLEPSAAGRAVGPGTVGSTSGSYLSAAGLPYAGPAGARLAADGLSDRLRAGGPNPVEATLVPVGRMPAHVVAGDLEARLLEPDDDPDAPADEMTEYNRYLATLALKGRPKTWRNPRGL